MRYRKKPVVVEAFQMTRERRDDNSEWPEWLHRAWNMEHDEVGSCYPFGGTDRLAIYTLEGEQVVSWGDYIVQGTKKELYPCKPDIFEMVHEPVDEGHATKSVKQIREELYDEMTSVAGMLHKWHIRTGNELWGVVEGLKRALTIMADCTDEDRE